MQILMRKNIPDFRLFSLLLATSFFFSAGMLAQDDIPESPGFGGFVLTGPGVFSIKSNTLVTGPPLLGDVGNKRIASVFESPESNTAIAWAFAGEVNYTFSKSRTQIFFGNRLEDVLRLDVPFGLGVRQELKDKSIMAFSLLSTPAELKFWADPYVENEDREKTTLTLKGLRWRWGRMFKTGLELTATVRWYRYDLEKSGSWLVDQRRLETEDLALLTRDGNIMRFQGLYRFNLGAKHRLEPAIQAIFDNRIGNAVANQGFAGKLTYLYLTPKIILDFNVVYGQRNAQEVHPVYNERGDSDRFGIAFTFIKPFKVTEKSIWSFWGSAEYFQEDSKIDFFDSSVTALMAGIAWKSRTKSFGDGN
mgnify:CR=1 FL=1